MPATPQLDRGPQPFWIPSTNVFVSDSGCLIVQVELSSLRSENLEITVEGFTLRITGERLNSEFAAAKTILVHEMHAGPFESVLEIPPQFAPARATASYFNGVLSITVPTQDSSSPTQTDR